MLVIVYVPLLESEYSIFIPVNKKVGTVKNNIIDTISELYDGSLILDRHKLGLYDSEKTTIYNNDIPVKYSGITNGTKLILVWRKLYAF